MTEDGLFLGLGDARFVEDIRIVDVIKDGTQIGGVDRVRTGEFRALEGILVVTKNRDEHRKLVDFRAIERHVEIGGGIISRRELAVAIVHVIREVRVNRAEIHAFDVDGIVEHEGFV